MKRYLIALVCVCAAVCALGDSSSSSLAWRRFKSEHAKVYGPEEDAIRFANFLATKQLVERHNADPNATFKMGLNHLADWTREERQKLTGVKLSDTHRLEGGSALTPELAKLLDGPVPKEVDWRKVSNRVTDVKHQSSCNSAWAFATTGLLEGQQAALNMSGLIPLSEQELVDCSPSNHKCNSGFPKWALEDIAHELGGIESGADYPYEDVDTTCTIDKSKFVMTTKGSLYLKRGDEQALLKAVANYGPVAVAIMVTDNFYHYRSGVFFDPLCTPNDPNVNHFVLVVGYGTDARGGDYWLVKNSWGPKWGRKGYIKMQRRANMCAIADYATVAHF